MTIKDSVYYTTWASVSSSVNNSVSNAAWLPVIGPEIRDDVWYAVREGVSAVVRDSTALLLYQKINERL
jgi:hypothetical protein